MDHGCATVDPTAGVADCHLSVEPYALLAYVVGLTSIMRGVLQMNFAGVGRKPSLALRLPKYVPPLPHGGLAKPPPLPRRDLRFAVSGEHHR